MSVKLPFQKPAQKPSSLKPSLGLWLSCTMRWSLFHKGVVLRETNSEFASENRPFVPKCHLPTIEFQGLWLLVSGRISLIFGERSKVFPRRPTGLFGHRRQNSASGTSSHSKYRSAGSFFGYLSYSRCSMYGILPYVYSQNYPNVGK